MRYVDVVVVGGGPAGMAAAISANETGASTLIVDRDDRLGGILNQCVHSGFGLQYFGRELTGPEYAQLFAEKIADKKIDVLLNSFVTELTKEKELTVLSHGRGLLKIKAKAVVFAMGCRERTSGALALSGDRPVGVWTAGVAQHIANFDGHLLGKEIVILGSGDIGLITARRMMLEGANVKMVCEIMPYSNGTERNIRQCLQDFAIPLHLSTTVTRVKGKKRVEGVYIAQVDEKRNPILSTEKFVACDCLLLSVGLIPENELSTPLGMQMDATTNGAVVDEYRHTSLDGFFACGNALHVHDSVDNVSQEAHIAGLSAGLFAQGKMEKSNKVNLCAGEGIRYVLPQKLNLDTASAVLFFRLNEVLQNVKIVAESNGKIVASKRYVRLAPGEMGSLKIEKSKISTDIVLKAEGEKL